MSKISLFLKKNSPAILVGFGVASMTTSIIFAIKDTPKALQLKKDAEYEKKRKLTKMETLKVCGRCYIPTVTFAVLSAGCSIAAHSMHVKRRAAMATAYALTENAFKEYKDQVIETVGKNKEKDICGNIAKKNAEKTLTNDISQAYNTGLGETLFLDNLTKRTFFSNEQNVLSAINKANEAIIQSGSISLNDYCDFMQIPRLYIEKDGVDGDSVGWNAFDGLVDVIKPMPSTALDDGRACRLIYHNKMPKDGYWKMG